MTDIVSDKVMSASAADTVPVRPASEQYNRYNMTLPQSFSIYNDEGSVLYRGEVEQMANQLRAELFGEEVRQEPAKVEPEKKAAKGKAYDKKRAFFLVVPMLLSLVLLAIFIVPLFVEKAQQYVSIYNVNLAKANYIVALDPAYGFLASKFHFNASVIPNTFVELFPIEEGAKFAAAGYAVCVATVLYAVFALIMLIVSIVGLAGKKKDGFYQKAKLGYLSIVLFVCGLILAVGGVLLSGGIASDLIGFFTGKYIVTFGYGWIALVVIPVLTFLCTCVAYRKAK